MFICRSYDQKTKWLFFGTLCIYLFTYLLFPLRLGTTHYQYSRPVNTGTVYRTRVSTGRFGKSIVVQGFFAKTASGHGCSVHGTRVHGSCGPAPVNTAREHGQRVQSLTVSCVTLYSDARLASHGTRYGSGSGLLTPVDRAGSPARPSRRNSPPRQRRPVRSLVI